jgi:hypothetical protein
MRSAAPWDYAEILTLDRVMAGLVPAIYAELLRNDNLLKRNAFYLNAIGVSRRGCPRQARA